MSEINTEKENVAPLSESQKKAIDILLKEYDRIIGEIKSIQETQRRMIGFLPGALAVGLPFLLKPTSDVPSELRISIFLGFGFMFLLIVSNYIGLTRGILRLSLYQMEYISTKINEIIPEMNSTLLFWETYVRKNVRQKNKELIGFSMIHGAEFLLLSSPSLACFGIGMYFFVAPGINFTAIVIAVIYVAIWLANIYFAYITVSESKEIPALALHANKISPKVEI